MNRYDDIIYAQREAIDKRSRFDWEANALADELIAHLVKYIGGPEDTVSPCAIEEHGGHNGEPNGQPGRVLDEYGLHFAVQIRYGVDDAQRSHTYTFTIVRDGSGFRVSGMRENGGHIYVEKHNSEHLDEWADVAYRKILDDAGEVPRAFER
jgi:hypothetical protein